MKKDLIRTYKLALLGVETYLSFKDVEIITKLYNIFSGLEILSYATPRNMTIEYCRNIGDNYKPVFELFYITTIQTGKPYIRIIEKLDDELKNDLFVANIISDIYRFEEPHRILYQSISDEITEKAQRFLTKIDDKLKQIGIDTKRYNTDI